MAKEDSEPQGKSWKEQWDILSKRGSILTKDVGQMLSDQGKRITKASVEAASQAKDSIDKVRQQRLMEKMAKDVEEILSETENGPVNEEEVERLRLLVATLEVRQKEQEALIEEMSEFGNEVTQSSGEIEGNLGFFATISQTYALIGFAVIWSLFLMLATSYIESNEMKIMDLPADSFVWIIGTMIWAFVVISQLSRSGSFDKLPLSFRIQSTIGVGIATTAISLLPEIDQMPAMFQIFSWLVIVSLSILLMSSIVNGYRAMTS